MGLLLSDVGQQPSQHLRPRHLLSKLISVCNTAILEIIRHCGVGAPPNSHSVFDHHGTTGEEIEEREDEEGGEGGSAEDGGAGRAISSMAV
ncbi:hypothetical protein MRB53_026223 [Persea americana]|uniref:Uncharacterized protein n=1 Tax=Persea americana TaxID=3435 RepID=A0ACC2LHL5_PERAE|nr:hypothetical protein MRB53_026223 [Persea americana]